MAIRARQPRRVVEVLILGVALTTATGATAGGNGFGGYRIEITPTGLTPAAARVGAYSVLPTWVNNDSVERTVSFLDGRCTMVIPPGGSAACRSASLYAGTYRYHVSGTEANGEITVVPQRRSVALLSSRSIVRAGRRVVLSGRVEVAGIAVPPPYPQTITLLRRSSGSHRFEPFRRILCLPRTCRGYAWRVSIRPTATATYVARLADPREKVIWEDAESARVDVRLVGSSG